MPYTHTYRYVVVGNVHTFNKRYVMRIRVYMYVSFYVFFAGVGRTCSI